MAHAAGIALPLLGAEVPSALLLSGFFVALLPLWKRPWPVGAVITSIVAGVFSGHAVRARTLSDCRLHLPTHWEGVVEGRILVRPVPGTSLPFELEGGGPGGCTGELRVVLTEPDAGARTLSAAGKLPPAGERIRARATWEGRSFPDPGWIDRAGIFRLATDWEVTGESGLYGRLVGARGAVQARIFELWGETMGPIVEALVLARTEHLDPDLRDAFALSGTAHILSISGFHVGVIAGLLVGLLRWVGLGRVRAEWGAVSGCWLYVLGIGAPHAAVRAVLLISLLAWARSRGRPVMNTGALASALLLLLAARPDWIASIGFQLSFAGTAGLVLFRPPLVASLSDRLPGAENDGAFTSGRRGWKRQLRRVVIEGVGAGVAATVATVPLVAWHFDRVSLMSVPSTMAIAPAVAAALPGVGVSLLLSVFSMDLGRFLAGGTALLLDVMVQGSVWFAALPGAAVWISRELLLTVAIVFSATTVLLRAAYPRKVTPRVRVFAAAIACSTAAIVLPLFAATGSLEVHVIDVGQGDAVALRTPTGRWLLVDAGPRSRTFDSGARRVLPYLRRHGVRELEMVLLTHPHLDHIGGAPAVLEDLSVRGILDPSHPAPSGDYLAVLEAAIAAGASWWGGTDELDFELDGVRVAVLHPGAGDIDGRIEDLNDLSLVTLVTWGRASVLLTGDASADIERAILDALPPVGLSRLSVLKLGHHGSRTSTSTELLDHTRPHVAVLSAGDGNSFGHPHQVVMERLDAAGIPVYRTDRDGDVRILIASDGTVEVRPSR